MADARATRFCAALGALLVSATAYPGLLQPSDDSYPLSTYPMFSRDRGRTLPIAAAHLRFANGVEETLPPAMVANGEVMQAIQRLNRGMRRGRRGRQRLCRDIAGRVASRGSARQRSAREVLLVQTKVDTLAFLRDRGGMKTRGGTHTGRSEAHAPPIAGDRRVRARCELPEGT